MKEIKELKKIAIELGAKESILNDLEKELSKDEFKEKLQAFIESKRPEEDKKPKEQTKPEKSKYDSLTKEDLIKIVENQDNQISILENKLQRARKLGAPRGMKR